MNTLIENEKLQEKLDKLTKEIFLEITRLVKENKMLREECIALRTQLQNIEMQVYNGKTY